MEGQLSIFDLFAEVTDDLDLDKIGIVEIVRRISERLNLTFTYNSYLDVYEYKKKKGKLTLSLSHYSIDDKRPFISVRADGHNEGFGIPCDTFDEAIKWLKRGIERFF